MGCTVRIPETQEHVEGEGEGEVVYRGIIQSTGYGELHLFERAGMHCRASKIRERYRERQRDSAHTQRERETTERERE